METLGNRIVTSVKMIPTITKARWAVLPGWERVHFGRRRVKENRFKSCLRQDMALAGLGNIHRICMVLGGEGRGGYEVNRVWYLEAAFE